MKFGIGQAVTRIEDDRLARPSPVAAAMPMTSICRRRCIWCWCARRIRMRASSQLMPSREVLDGVVAVYTGADLSAAGVAPFPTSPGFKNAAAAR
jgi:hypothetical protein